MTPPFTNFLLPPKPRDQRASLRANARSIGSIANAQHTTFSTCGYLPPPTALTRLSEQRIAISPRSHRQLTVLARKRFGGHGRISKLGSLVLGEYLSHMERVYFGAAGLKAVETVPAGQRNYDAVLFDMDGVLCDSEMASRQAGVAVFKKFYGVDVRSDDFAAFTGTGEANFLAGVAGLYGIEGFDGEKAKEEFFDVYIEGGYTAELRPFAGVQGLVQRVKDLGMKVAVASAADRVKVEANLAAIGLAKETFDFVTSSEGIANKKPAPDVFLAAAEGCGVAPARCVVVEDAAAGVIAAKRAGMRCIAVETSLDRVELEEAGADVIRGEPALIAIDDILGREALV